MLRKFLLPSVLGLCSLPVHAQLYTGPVTGMVIKGGTTVSVDSMVLSPSADITLSGIEVSVVDTPITAIGGASISKVMRFSSPLQFQGTLGLYYRDDQLNGNAAATLQLAYRDSLPSGWTTTNSSTVNVAAHYLSYIFTAPQQLSLVTATTGGVNLPINLNRFTAVAGDGRVRLDWEMLTDAVQDIQVQHTADGKHFLTLGSVTASRMQQSYQFIDEAPVNGKNYYRLYWNNDGKEHYSPVRTVMFDQHSNDRLVLHPLPTETVLNISLPAAPQRGSYIQLVAAGGNVLYRENCRQQQMSLDMKAYPPGMYFLSWVNGSTVQYYRIPKR